MKINRLKNKRFRHVEPPHPIADMKSYQHDVGRMYVTPDGYAYPSVTTVVNHQKEEIFQEWRERVGEEEAERIANQGTLVHDLTEQHLRNEPVNLQGLGTAARLFLNLKRKFKDLDDIYALEAPLYTDRLMLAGRVDCVAKYKGELSVIDFKTTQKAKKREWLDSYFMQAAAYSLMWKELQGIDIRQCVILMTGEDGTLTHYIEQPKDWIKPLYDVTKAFYLTYENRLV